MLLRLLKPEILFAVSLLLAPAAGAYAQEPGQGPVVCDFTIPDTVCTGTPVTIENLSQGGTTFFWKFCPGTPLSFPQGIYSGPLQSQLHIPLAITLVQEGNRYYAFITNSGDQTIERVTWTTSLVNQPSYDVLDIHGLFSNLISGIQVKYDNGWYGFVTDGNRLFRLSFGPTLDNLSPSVSIVATSTLMNTPTGLVIGFDGADWVGFCSNFPDKTITRFAWGNTLASTPAVTDLGNVGGLTRPMQPALIADSSGWHMFVSNTTSLAQLKFGSSLMNIPTGINLGNLTWISDNRGVSTYTECNTPYLLVANHNAIKNQLFQVHFKEGLNGPKVLTPLGSVGNLFETVGLSETMISGDTIFCVALNSYPSLSTIYFIPCTNPTMPTSTLFDPSPVVFPEPGTYTVKLTVDEGLPTEQQVCRETEAVSPEFSLGADTALCEGNTLLISAGAGYESYAWNTGDTTSAILADTTGLYAVTVTDRFGCMASDSIILTIKPVTYSTVDTAICAGESYLAGGQLQTEPGTYYDSLTGQNGCPYIITTYLTVHPEIVFDIGQDTCITQDTAIVLHLTVPGAQDYTWQDGSHDTLMMVTAPGTYWVRVSVGPCDRTDSITFTPCAEPVYFYIPTAFSPNGDGRNDVFRPVASEVTDIHLVIFDRWGQMIFETRDILQGWNGIYKGTYCDPGVYSYILTYKEPGTGKDKQVRGTVVLVRKAN